MHTRSSSTRLIIMSSCTEIHKCRGKKLMVLANSFVHPTLRTLPCVFFCCSAIKHQHRALSHISSLQDLGGWNFYCLDNCLLQWQWRRQDKVYTGLKGCFSDVTSSILLAEASLMITPYLKWARNCNFSPSWRQEKQNICKQSHQLLGNVPKVTLPGPLPRLLVEAPTWVFRASLNCVLSDVRVPKGRTTSVTISAMWINCLGFFAAANNNTAKWNNSNGVTEVHMR